MTAKPIRPACRPLDATVNLPGSKSLTNRALIAAALADGESTLTGALFSDDTELMMAALQTLGVRVAEDRACCSIKVTGCGGHLPASEADLYCGNSGTTIRFCTALCALGFGPYRLDGNDRMRLRPIGDLVSALQSAGVLIEFENREGYPPLVVHAGGLRGGEMSLDSPPSSQYVSALLLAAPYARGDVMIEIRGTVVSAPYLAMTTRLMDAFGVSVIETIGAGGAKFIVPAPQRYCGTVYAIEPDASNASYFFAAAAIAGGRVTVAGLGESSVQGDVKFVDVLERMGCRIERGADSITVFGPAKGERLRGVDVDLCDMPDVAQTLAVVALFAEGSTAIRNVGNLRIKETDRLAALGAELSKLGARVELFDDAIIIHPPANPAPARIATYDDHRMAMSFALAGLAIDGVEILDPTCVNKTFPDFFEHFERLTG